MSQPALRLVEGSSMDKSKALSAALSQIERQFGKGSIMKLGKNDKAMDIEAISTGSLGLDIALGAIAVALGLALRLRSMSQWIMWEVAWLFENIGTVQDGIGMLTKPVAITDQSDAGTLVVGRGEIRFDHARFHYGRTSKVI